MALSEEHLKDLLVSGLSEETIKNAGIYSERPGDITKILGWNAPVNSLLAFPYPGTEFVRWKLFPSLKQHDGHTMKYFQPKKSAVEIYVPHGVDLNQDLIITEGEKKALKAVQEGLNCIALGGIWNFAIKDENEKPQLIESLERIDWEKKKVEICPDGDFQEKTGVCHAIYRLSRMLESNGAEVKIIKLPIDEKLDDYLLKKDIFDFANLPRLTLDDPIFKSISPKEPLDVERVTLEFSDFINLDVPERPRLISWLPAGGLIMVYGPRGIGKTFFVLSLALSLCQGTSFLKWDVQKSVGALMVDGEMSINMLKERLLVLLKDSNSPARPLFILSGEHVYLKVGTDLCLTDQKVQNNVLNFLDKKNEIGAVVMDNISCLFTGLRESDKQDWEKIMPFLLAMRRRGIAVILVHHSGKSGDQRGTSGREDLLDAVVKLDPVPGKENEGATFVVRFSKCRGIYGNEVEPIEVSLNTEVTGSWLWKEWQESALERMISLIKDGIDTVTDLANELEVSKAFVSKLKHKGIKDGIFLSNRKLILAEKNEEKRSDIYG